MPPIAEIRDAVLDVRVEERRPSLAEQALVAMRDELLPDDAADEASTDEESEDDAEPLTTADAFRAAAEARGLEVGVRDWLDRRATEQDDPQWSDEVNTLVRSNASLTRSPTATSATCCVRSARSTRSTSCAPTGTARCPSTA
ncbi:MAG: hypothetical protein R3F34_07950 [Planctomycetota bacterium]